MNCEKSPCQALVSAFATTSRRNIHYHPSPSTPPKPKNRPGPTTTTGGPHTLPGYRRASITPYPMPQPLLPSFISSYRHSTLNLHPPPPCTSIHHMHPNSNHNPKSPHQNDPNQEGQSTTQRQTPTPKPNRILKLKEK